MKFKRISKPQKGGEPQENMEPGRSEECQKQENLVNSGKQESKESEEVLTHPFCVIFYGILQLTTETTSGPSLIRDSCGN